VHFSPKGIVAVSQYRKVGVTFTPAGSPIRATFGRLEPCEGKLSSTVLRGLGAGNSPRLPGEIPGQQFRAVSSTWSKDPRTTGLPIFTSKRFGNGTKIRRGQVACAFQN